MEGPQKRTTDPITTGNSVIGFKYNGGVVVVADTLVSYGSMARYAYTSRIISLPHNIILAGSGEYSDFQELQSIAETFLREDDRHDDGKSATARDLWNYLSRVLYSKRTKVEPYWNAIIVAGMDRDNTTPFLGMADLYGTSYECDAGASGYARDLSLPYIRAHQSADLTREQAHQLAQDAMRILVYRDARASPRIEIADVSRDGLRRTDPFIVETAGHWGIGEIAISDPTI